MNKPGLTQKEAEKRLKKYGLNEIKHKKKIADWQIVLDQIRSPLIYVLLGAMVITGGILKDFEDTVIIGVAVVFNTLMGFFQERKANRSLEALADVLAPKAKVRRDNKWIEIEAAEVTIGDMCRLEIGNRIPADGKVIKGDSLNCNEAILTGESVAVNKKLKDKVFMGTMIASGIGVMEVEKIGGETELGKIALSLQEAKEPETPLQRQLNRLAKGLTYVVVAVAVLVAGVGLETGMSLKEIFPIAVALAVASIPEGLAVALTLILTVGMQRILKKKALVRKLMAAETLGGVSVICSDKTGTLTEGEMRVVAKFDSLSGGGENDDYLVQAAVLCNDMRDPLEMGMMNWARDRLAKQGKTTEGLKKDFKRLDEIPFNPEYRYIATWHQWRQEEEGKVLFVSGAPEEILARCRVSQKQAWKRKFEMEAKKGHRLVGFAYKKIKSKQTKIKQAMIKDLEWLGVLVYEDPIREGVATALKRAIKAGVKVKVITGDYRFTAEAIVNQLKLKKKKLTTNEIIEGDQLEKMSQEELLQVIDRVILFVRIKPEQKLKIVEALQKKGEVVAMTGDGVNDALSLKKADIGIVVEGASDVAKETADMVLMDNNFATILDSVAEGRLIRDNLKKVILYLLADSFGEIAIVVMSLLTRVPLALTAGMILWVNLVSDGFPNLALTVEPAEGNLLARKVEKRENWLIDSEIIWLIALISLVSAVTAFAAFKYYWHHPGYGLAHARTVAFSLLGLNSLVYVWSARSLHLPVWKVKWNQNSWLIIAVAAGLGLQLVGLYSRFGQRLLGTVNMTMSEWLVIGSGSLLMIVIVETVKWIYNKKS